ncbi:Ig-like domain-containing protein [Cohnella sp. WQ 127256]|uniref:Ig-like domain-containing protein n=1 Tax=Cohnella sp. WQ 127256 TaxID=2938790 RepID=UPI00211753DC|nr:S-layer homology domain-containing protein [Cohnella sp. WQ 127256]
MNRRGLNRATVVLIVISMIAGMLLTMGMPKAVYAEEDTVNFSGGEGTLENPYKVATALELSHVNIPGPGAYFEQAAHIELTGNWMPLGTFRGIYDGNDFIVSNMTINSSENKVGLFSELSSGAVLKNIKLDNFNINTTGVDSFVGSLVGHINVNATIRDSTSSGVITFTDSNYVGGLAGYNEGSVSESSSKATITSLGSDNFSAGGLVGSNSGTISGSNTSGSLTVNHQQAYAGGLVGTNSGSVNDSGSSNTVTAGDIASVGGLVGNNFSNGTISGSYSTGSVSGNTNSVVGGLIGRNSGSINGSYSTGSAIAGSGGMAGGLIGYKANGSIDNSYSTGNASGNGAVFVGGLVGFNSGGDVSNSYSTGSASGGTDANGGLIGFKQGVGDVNNSYYYSTGGITSNGGTPKNAAELMQQTTFSSWNFNTIWRIAEGYTYPSLIWQPLSANESTAFDYRDLTWNFIKGVNSTENDVTEDLNLPAIGPAGSTIMWSVSQSGLINTGTGKVTRATDDDHEVTLTATISKSGGLTRTKQFILTVIEAPNNKPSRRPTVNATATAKVTVNTEYSIDLSTIFEDVDGDPLSYFVSIEGTAAEIAATAYTYTPTAAGTVTLVFTVSDGEELSNDTYTVELTANTMPVRKADVTATDEVALTVNAPYTLDLSTVFEDADGEGLTYKVSVNGATAVTAITAYTYTPTTAGTVTLVFTANDGTIDSIDTYTVELTVNTVPVRQADVGATAEAIVTVNTPYTLDLATVFEDADGDGMTYKVVVDGAAAVVADENYTYTPVVAGTVTVVFTANDGTIDSTDTYTVELTVNTVPVRQADVGATAEAIVTVNTPYTLDLTTVFEDADGDGLTYKVAVDGAVAVVANENYTYTPTTAGTVTLVFIANDGTIDSTDTYTVELTVNTVPVRQADVGATAEAIVTVNTPYTLDLTTVFEDADGDGLTYKVAVDGAVAVVANENYTYTPTTAGTVTLVFIANDGTIDSTDTYTVELTVNTVPVRQADVGATAEAIVTVNTPYTLDLTTVFEDADGDGLTYKVSVNGATVVAANENYTYTPTTAGTVTLVFTANDGTIDSTDTYTVELTVNTVPNRKADVTATKDVALTVNTSYTLDLATVFEDADDDGLTYKVSVDGTAAEAANSTYTYTPTSVGTMTLVFTAHDGSAASADTYTVKLIVSQPSNGNGNSNSGGNGGGSSTRTTDYNVTITGPVGTTLPVKVDSTKGLASISVGALTEKIFNAENKTIITFPVIPDVKAYTIEMLATSLSNRIRTGELVFKTSAGSITIPDDMLRGVADIDGKVASITVGIGNKNQLSAKAAADVGDRPLVELTLALNGIKTSWNNPASPVRISIPYVPTAEELKDPEHIVIWYIDGSGNAVSVPSGRYDKESGTVTFVTTHFSTYAVAYVHKVFGDLGGLNWAKHPIEVMASKGIISGTLAEMFAPTAPITRADYLVLLVKTLGLTAEFNGSGSFADVDSNAYYYEALGIAKQIGIAEGNGSNEFHPKEQISRQDMMVLTARALTKFKGLKVANNLTGMEQYSDKKDVAVYAESSLKILAQAGLITGSGGKLNPRALTLRAEAAVFLYRIYNQY